MAKGYIQIIELDYGDTYSPLAKIVYVRLCPTIVVLQQRPLYQLDLKNVFS